MSIDANDGSRDGLEDPAAVEAADATASEGGAGGSLVTHGVRLRPLEARDAALIAAWGDDLLFCDEAGWSRDLDPAERRARWAELVADLPADLVRLAGVLDGEVVGYVDLHGTEPGRRELGYLVGGRERWGRGIGTALARAGLAYGFDVLGLDEVWAEAADANTASVRVLQKVGMTETGRGSETWYLDRPTFHRQFAITRPEHHVRRHPPSPQARGVPLASLG